MNRFFRVASLVATISVIGCLGASSDISGGLTPTHFAWVRGRVLTISGQGVPFAPLGVHIPTNRLPSSYVLQAGSTIETGDYELVLERVHDVGTLPTPDTMTVYVLVATQSLGTTRLDSAQATLNFIPVGTPTDPQIVDIHTGVP